MRGSSRTTSFICHACIGQFSKAAGRRTFTSVLTVPSFAPSSTPELDALFHDFRENLFVPDALSRQHRRLVYRPSRQTVLSDEPGVTVTIGDDEEEVKLVPRAYNERPSTRKNLVRVRNLLIDNDDDTAWQNLLPFSQGLTTSKIKNLTGGMDVFREQVIRLAFMQGKSKHIVKLFEQSNKTGFTFANPWQANRFMLGCHLNAVAAEFSGPDFDATAHDAEVGARMMERDEHCGGIGKTNQDPTAVVFDSRQSLLTISVLLEMAAAKSINDHASKDVGGKVSNYLSKALALTERGIDDGTTPYICRDPHRSEFDNINYNEEPALKVLSSAFSMAARVDGISENQKETLESRLLPLSKRLKYLEERKRVLYEQREQKRAARSSQ